MQRVDSEFLATCFDAHAAALVLYARQWLPAPLAEDVVQEVFVRLAGQAEAPPNPRAWLLACTRNGAFDALKGARRRRARDAAAVQERRPLFEHAAETALEASEAQAALAALPATEREIVTLRLWAGATFAEIAALLDVPLSTVHQRYRAALEALKTRWESPCRNR
ncbi:MAG TPA: RNA polymerase sigma factor [Phycisphaerae bacterium]|nr:RNA polymerase sigma factor [Phycisphaerae bacterium]